MSQRKHIPPELDEIVDKVLAYTPSKTLTEPEEQFGLDIESWSTSISEIFNTRGVRLDATHFNPQSANVLEQLRNSGRELV